MPWFFVSVTHLQNLLPMSFKNRQRRLSMEVDSHVEELSMDSVRVAEQLKDAARFPIDSPNSSIDLEPLRAGGAPHNSVVVAMQLGASQLGTSHLSAACSAIIGQYSCHGTNDFRPKVNQDAGMLPAMRRSCPSPFPPSQFPPLPPQARCPTQTTLRRCSCQFSTGMGPMAAPSRLGR